MVMIVMGHLYVHGIGYAHDEAYREGGIDWNLFVLPLLYYHVDTFVFISGFYGIKITKHKFISFLLMLAFYGVVNKVLYLLVYYKAEFFSHLNLLDLGDILPVTRDTWWFITHYFYLMCMSPFLDFNDSKCKSQRLTGFCMLLFVGCGLGYVFEQYYYIVTFVTIYLMGRYLNNSPNNIFERYSFRIYICSVVLLQLQLLLMILYCNHDSNLFYFTTRYNHPLVITAAISFFYLFKRIKISYMPTVNLIASGTLAAYLITDGMIASSLNHKIIDVVGSNPLLLLVLSFCIVTLCSIFEQGRRRMFQLFGV